jgi:hypothetical protein
VPTARMEMENLNEQMDMKFEEARCEGRNWGKG